MLAGTVFPAVIARSQTKKPLVAILEGTSEASAYAYLEPFTATLRERGLIEGETIELLRRFADGDAGRYRAIAEELVNRNPAVIVTGSTTATLACKRLTATIPIISANLTDPVGLGLVASIARPGGNVTGMVISMAGQPGKLLQILRDIVPGITRVGLLVQPSERASARQREVAEGFVQGLGMQLITADFGSGSELANAFEKLARDDVQGLYVPSSLIIRTERKRFAELALAARLPSVCNAREIVEAGGLISYGASLRENYRRAALYVHRVLAGAKPADLPVENPTKFVLTINRRTERALGVTIPPPLLAFADEVID